MSLPEHRLLTVEEQTLAPADGDLRRDQRSPAAIAIGRQQYHPRQVLAGALVLVGLLAIAVGWFGAGGNNDVWQQIPFLVSGGIGGAALVALGVVAYLSYEHLEDRRAVATLVDRLDELELGLAGEFDALAAEVRGLAASTRRPARRSTPV